MIFDVIYSFLDLKFEKYDDNISKFIYFLKLFPSIS